MTVSSSRRRAFIPGTAIIFWMYSCTLPITLKASERDMARGEQREGRRRRKDEVDGYQAVGQALEEEEGRKARTTRCVDG